MFGTKTLKLAGIFGALTLLAACASTGNGPDIDASNGADGDMGAQAGGPVPGSQGDLEASAGNRVFFDYNQYTLTPDARDTLARQAAWLKEYPETEVMVAGNCDERGTREYNLALGARRAEAARSYLTSLGIDGSRIRTVSYGKERPDCSQSTESCWATNRNGTTMLVGADA